MRIVGSDTFGGGSRIDPKAPLTAPKHPFIIQGWMQWIGAYSRAVSCPLWLFSAMDDGN